MAKALPPRPNLDHLRRQAKTLLAALDDGEAQAAKAFIAHLPAAKALTPARVREAGFRLADAQSVVARKAGFASWPGLAHHVQDLRGLEGEWRFASLEIDGGAMPEAAIGASRLLIDGDRFRMESPEAAYDGVFLIDVEASPRTIDIEFVEGPEAGQTARGIYRLEGDRLTICLGLVGSTRPKGFTTAKGSGHALETLTRASAARPLGVTGGTRQSKAAAAKAEPADVAPRGPIDRSGFEGPLTPLLERLQGEWAAVSLTRDGIPTKDEWLPYGSRTTIGPEMKVVFGGQTMTHALMRFDESASPIAVDYLLLTGAGAGRVSLGLFAWRGDDAEFAVAPPEAARPMSFATGRGVTVSRWRRPT